MIPRIPKLLRTLTVVVCGWTLQCCSQQLLSLQNWWGGPPTNIDSSSLLPFQAKWISSSLFLFLSCSPLLLPSAIDVDVGPSCSTGLASQSSAAAVLQWQPPLQGREHNTHARILKGEAMWVTSPSQSQWCFCMIPLQVWTMWYQIYFAPTTAPAAIETSAWFLISGMPSLGHRC